MMTFCLASLILAAVMDDTELKTLIEKELRESPVVEVDDIEVTVSTGIVTLVGEVPSIAADQRAVEIARSIEGVRSVIDLVDVSVVPRSNDELRRLVEKKISDTGVEVRVSGGQVILSGEVYSRTKRQWVERLVQSIPGVQAIDNRLVVRYVSSRPDSDILRDVLQQFQWDVQLDARSIDVTVFDGIVGLKGPIGSKDERIRARTNARVDGVREVSDELVIDSSLAEGHHRDPGFVSVEPAEIVQAIRDAWLRHPQVGTIEARIEASYGAVELFGEVSALSPKVAAEQTAGNTHGVRRVKSFLQVARKQPRDDDEIKRDILHAFAEDPIVDRFEIAVTVLDGEVFLRGAIDSYYEKARAEGIALRVPGVVELHNRLEVSDSGPEYDPEFYAFDPVKATEGAHVGTIHVRPDADIKRAIESQLWWSPQVNSNQVTVKVESGVATLTGAVNSTLEARAAIANAMQGGAVVIKNQLKIKNR